MNSCLKHKQGWLLCNVVGNQKNPYWNRVVPNTKRSLTVLMLEVTVGEPWTCALAGHALYTLLNPWSGYTVIGWLRPIRKRERGQQTNGLLLLHSESPFLDVSRQPLREVL